ncbi:MAG: DNA alkylation repair protein [Candidatus Margulisbacteria bacterium]|nr:DNA alkylation repair protein [Candidatus Margulisiibacteriota bacterium]MBU1021287.1 DNA alkylation repair protein [Candidatus Margulisiibacteriota bacterium]MBU1729224.1 DNA alkylation repair protein [Candidatus Margulisiibacteriota bacterium]MBU1954897.1 DNA alkylation repair protein [Candidatus Margulisiibacteriota bacterium]
MQFKSIIKKLESLTNQECIDGMARYGIVSKKVYGVSLPELRAMAAKIGIDQKLAEKLWKFGAYETKILAPLIVDPKKVDDKLLEKWVKDFDNWAVCDNACMHLFRKTDLAHKKVREWTKRKEEFAKRAGFALMSTLVVHDKSASDALFIKYLSIIKKEATDGRHYVKKSVNWALRTIGKKNKNLNKKAIVTAREIKKLDSKSAKWIAADALRELTSEKIKKRLKK